MSCPTHVTDNEKLALVPIAAYFVAGGLKKSTHPKKAATRIVPVAYIRRSLGLEFELLFKVL